MSKPLRVGVLVLVAWLATAMQLRLAMKQGLWADEFFSLAMATGHSLEHPSVVAEPARGDFVEKPQPVTAGVMRRYLEFDTPPAGPARVIRAVMLSDTSPPLYYLLLNPWLRMFGTSDVALRAFSIGWALASLPLLAFLTFRLSGASAMLPAVVLMSAAPIGLVYATEGRMYSMLWCLALACIVVTLELEQRRLALWWPAWIVVSGAGLLTHYYFVFVWLACLGWLVVMPSTRRHAAAAAIVTGALVLPWYLLVPRMLAQWRVTGDWLNVPVTLNEALTVPFALAWDFVSGPRWYGMEMSDWLAAVVIGGIAVAQLCRSRAMRLQSPIVLLWVWLAAACIGPVVIDLLRGTGTARFSRYALAGLPAAMLLLAVALSRLSMRTRAIPLAALVAAWLHGDVTLLGTSNRQAQPYREIAAAANASSGPSDMVLVHSIPSGVLGIARYLRPEIRVASWVGQLGQRSVPRDVEALTEGASHVVLVRIHDVGAPAPEEDWLRANATIVEERQQNAGHVITFVPRRGERFAWPMRER